MCGIVGIVGRQSSDDLAKMSLVIQNRGTDDYGEYRDVESQVALATRRLSVVDIAGGHQPMVSDDGQFVIVYNGELYNAGELRSELTRKGIRFKTLASDTEVLLNLYCEYQVEMLQKLNGIFAFVIYDKLRKILFGARDQVGVKPLYYMLKPNFFSFASESKSFLSLSAFSREVDQESLFHYASLLYVPRQQSIFASVKKLLPGHYFKYDVTTSQFTSQSYWDFDFTRPNHQLSVPDWRVKIRSELKAAVKRQLMSDVPIACSLSGGIDSSALVGLLAEIGYGQLSTYSLGFSEEREQAYSELRLAKKVAEKWGAIHYEFTLSSDEVLNDLIQMVWQLDEPYGGGLPSWYIYKMMSKRVKVCFTGTGGDEAFGNYGKFRQLERSIIGRVMLAAPILGSSNRVIERYYARPWYLWPDELKRRHLFEFNTAQRTNTVNLLKEIFENSRTNDYRNGIAYLDYKTQLPDEFLMMTDRFSMAHSVEARVPFLDLEFIKLISSIPSGVRTKSRDLKYLLKGAVSDLLPVEIMNAPKKGFVLPIHFWLQNKLKPLASRLLSSERLKQQGIFNPDFFRSHVEPTLLGRKDLSLQVWSMLMFQIWHVVFIEQECKTKPTFDWKNLC